MGEAHDQLVSTAKRVAAKHYPDATITEELQVNRYTEYETRLDLALFREEKGRPYLHGIEVKTREDPKIGRIEQQAHSYEKVCWRNSLWAPLGVIKNSSLRWNFSHDRWGFVALTDNDWHGFIRPPRKQITGPNNPEIYLTVLWRKELMQLVDKYDITLDEGYNNKQNLVSQISNRVALERPGDLYHSFVTLLLKRFAV